MLKKQQKKKLSQSENELASISSLSTANVRKRSQQKGKEKVYNLIKQISRRFNQSVKQKKYSLSGSSSSIFKKSFNKS